MDLDIDLDLDLHGPLGLPEDPVPEPEDDFDPTALLEDSVPPRATTPKVADEPIPTIENSDTQVSSPPRSPSSPVTVSRSPPNLGNEARFSPILPTELETSDVPPPSPMEAAPAVDTNQSVGSEAPSSSIVPTELETSGDTRQATPIPTTPRPSASEIRKTSMDVRQTPNPAPLVPSISEGLKTSTASIFGNATSKTATPTVPKTIDVQPSAKPSHSKSIGNIGTSSSNAASSTSGFSFASMATPRPERPANARPNFFNPAPSNRPTFFNPTPLNAPRLAPLRPVATAPIHIVASTIKKEDDVPNTPSMSVSPPRETAEASFDDSDSDSLFISQSTPTTNDRGNSRRPSSVGARGNSRQATQATQTTQENDSDDDLIEIDPKKAPMTVKRRWQEHQPSVIDDDDEASVKTEPEGDRPVRTGGGAQFPVRQGPAPAPLRPIPSRMNERAERSFLPGYPSRQREPINAPTASNAGPSGLSIVARQRMMLQNAKKSKPVNGSSSSAAASNRKPEEPEESNPKKRRRDGQLVPDDPTQVEAAMRDGEEDHSWMEQDDDTEDDYEVLAHRINILTSKYDNQKITHKEKLELFKLRKEKAVKDRLRAAARGGKANEGIEEPKLFLEETHSESIQRRRREHKERNAARSPDPEDEEEIEEEAEESHSPLSMSHASEHRSNEEDEHAGFVAMLRQELDGDGLEGIPTEEQLNAKPRKQRKKPAPRAKNAREFRDLQREKDKIRKIAKATKNAKGKKGAAGKGKGAKGKAKGKGKGKAKGKGKGRRGNDSDDEDDDSRPDFDDHHQASRNRRDGQDDIGQMILDNLMNNDPISDRILNPIFNLEPEPDIFGTNKETQLQKLFANIPAGTNVSQAKSDKNKLKEASKSFGYAKVRAKDGKWLVKGMKSTLYHHQLLGAQWMVSRELADSPPYGGLLADGMGLGKTVQTLACMVGNPPASGDRGRNIKATLIVVPSAVIDQWMDEIRNHAEVYAFPKIMHYRASSKIPVEVLQDLDIVLTSYHEVMNQFPFPDQKARESIAEMGYKKWWRGACKNLGDLHKVSWYRVVLDEAHAIKNNSARTSLACQNLKSIYRWCLTGTPLLNRLEELFPYLRFLKASYSMDWKTFQRHFCDPDADDCHQRIATLLSYTMMRRTMKTTILNRPIIVLPTPHPEIQYVEFSTEERIIYRITENRFRSNLNVYFGNRGGANRINYTIFLVQLLRLRQCTSHPFMLERTIRESWTSEDVQELKRRLARIKRETNLPFFEQCRLWVSEGEQERKAAQEARDRGEEVLQGPEVMPFGTGKYGHKFSMDKALKTLNEKKMYERVVCSLCSDIPMQPTITDCGHIFCNDCIMEHMHNHAAEYEDDIFECPSCDKMFQEITPYKGFHLDDEDGSSEGDTTSNNKRQKTTKRGNKDKDRYGGGSKGIDLMGFEPVTKDSTWISRSDYDPDFDLTPSTKTAALKAILLKGFEEAPLDKVVIYVQFRLLARIVGRICESENLGFLYLTGDSSLEHRSKVIHMFRTDSDAKILIAGLKCGGLGLNFPWANRCISLDLWWNHAVEQQAFGRIFRIGQKKETYMTRIVVRNTVDMRLLSMQMYKLKTCERAMCDGDKKDNPALELKDLARLFGFLRTDEDGEIIGIEADYDDGDDDYNLMDEME